MVQCTETKVITNLRPEGSSVGGKDKVPIGVLSTKVAPIIPTGKKAGFYCDR